RRTSATRGSPTRAVSGFSALVSHFARSSRVSRFPSLALPSAAGYAGFTSSQWRRKSPRICTNVGRRCARSRMTSVVGTFPCHRLDLVAVDRDVLAAAAVLLEPELHLVQLRDRLFQVRRAADRHRRLVARIEERVEPVVVLLRNRVVLVVVALRAAGGEAE